MAVSCLSFDFGKNATGGRRVVGDERASIPQMTELEVAGVDMFASAKKGSTIEQPPRVFFSPRLRPMHSVFRKRSGSLPKVEKVCASGIMHAPYVLGPGSLATDDDGTNPPTSLSARSSLATSETSVDSVTGAGLDPSVFAEMLPRGFRRRRRNGCDLGDGRLLGTHRDLADLGL